MSYATDNASSHFYLYPSGKPFYAVENKSKPGEMRSVTLRDAYKYIAVPSVSTIIDGGSPASWNLRNWWDSQLVMAALTMKPDLHEFDIEKIRDDAWNQVRQAGEFGDRVHAGMEAAAQGLQIPSELRPFVDPVMEWLNLKGAHCLGVEKSFAVDIEGILFGGKSDWIGSLGYKPTVIDFKTKETKGKSEIKPYEKWPVQLAAYAKALLPADSQLLTIVISRDEPGRFEPFFYDSTSEFWKTFKACYQVYCSPLGKNFNPDRIRKALYENSSPLGAETAGSQVTLAGA